MNCPLTTQALTGPIPTIRTPFDRHGEIDYASLAKMIDFVIEAGAKSVLLTAGDSHFEILSDREIGEVTRFTAKHVGKRAYLVAADYRYSTRNAIAFAQECRALGVDCYMVLPPDWAQSLTPDTLADHYAAIGEHIPVMMVTNLFIPRGIKFGLDTVKATMQRTRKVVALKDDMCGSFARHVTALVGDQWAVWAGGKKENHLNMAPYGAHGYLSTFLTFQPRIAHDYWKAWQDGRMTDVTRIITDIDMPFFELLTGPVRNFDAGIHATLEIFGLAQRWRPRPYTSATDADVEILRNWFAQKQLL